MKDVTQILYSLGFLESEVKTYMAALQQGPRTVLELTKSTGLSRQAIYVVIDSLTERGVMSSVMRGKKRYFVAEDPDKLLLYAKRKEQDLIQKIKDLEQSIPEMKLKIGGERPVVCLYEGMEGLRTHYLEIAKDKPVVIYEFSDLDALFTLVSREDMLPMIDSLKKVGSHFKGIYAGRPRGKTFPSERYFLPKEMSDFKSDIVVYEDKVSIWTYEGKIYSVAIENKMIAKMFKVLLELAIKGSQEYKEQ
ncbi:hypothetical protein HY620_02015 [Candidatus Uhrbacteria bacterium]|nr:hypothetical protein [Candidatus Uhrbacteria bacterium]